MLNREKQMEGMTNVAELCAMFAATVNGWDPKQEDRQEWWSDKMYEILLGETELEQFLKHGGLNARRSALALMLFAANGIPPALVQGMPPHVLATLINAVAEIENGSM
jgi:hypothetical protein